MVIRAALAHRLDECLQAATIRVEKEHVTIQMRLTPGIEVFSRVIKDMDANNDDIISTTEQTAYADRVVATCV